MNKKLMLMGALLSGIAAVAMDHTKEMAPGRDAFRNEEETWVKIWVTDSANFDIPHEIEIPIRLAKLMGTLNALVEDPKTKDSVFPLPNMTLVVWGLIEPQLEAVYGITRDEIRAVQLRKEIITAYSKLDAKSLIELIHSLDYADLPLLLEIACTVVKQSALGRFNFEQINSLPGDMGNRIILDKILASCGPMPASELAVCRGHEYGVRSVCVTKDGKIVSGSDDGTVRVWDSKGNQLALCRGHEDVVRSVCIAKDDKIVSGSDDGTVRVWDMQGNQLAVCMGYQGYATSVCVTNDGKIVSGSNQTVHVWDMEGKELAICRGHENVIWSVCVASDGKIVSGAYDNTVRIWDMEGKELAICRGHVGKVESVFVTSDCKIVSGSNDKTIHVWDIQGKLIVLCRGHEDVVTSVCVTKDGKIVSGSDDDRVLVWDMRGNQLAECRGHEDYILSVCVKKDGKIVSGSADQTVRLWDMLGKELAICRGHEGRVHSVCVAKDGKIVSGSNDKTVRVWDLGLLGRIVCMDQGQARLLWELLHNSSQRTAIGKQELWKEIEKILGEDAQVACATVNNNNESDAVIHQEENKYI